MDEIEASAQHTSNHYAAQASVSENQTEEIDVDASARKLNLRREARRKRILENAKSRLEKLNVRACGDNIVTAVENQVNVDYSDPEVEPNEQPEQFSLYNSLFSSTNYSVINNENSNSQTVKKKPSYIECRGHIFLVASIAFICTVLFGDGSIGFSLFIPVGLCIIVEKFYYQDQQPELDPTVTFLSALAGIEMHSANPLIITALGFISSIQSLVFDFGIIIFFSVLCTFILSTFSNMFITLTKIK